MSKVILCVFTSFFLLINKVYANKTTNEFLPIYFTQKDRSIKKDNRTTSLNISIFCAHYNYSKINTVDQDIKIRYIPYTINHFGISLSLEFRLNGRDEKKIVYWHNSANPVFEVGNTFFRYEENKGEILLIDYIVGYKHKFFFVTKINHLLPFIGPSASLIVNSVLLRRNLNQTITTLHSINYKFAASIELGIYYNDFFLGVDFNYNRLSDNDIGYLFSVGYRIF